MKQFFLRKIEIIQREQVQSGHSFITIFMEKGVRVVLDFILVLVDLLVLLFFLPLMLVVLIANRGKEKRRHVFFIGLEHVINKTVERGIGYQEKGYQSTFFSFEWSGMKHASPFHAEIKKYSFSMTIDTFVFLYYLITYKPAYVEVYFEGNCYRQLWAVLFAKLYGSVVVSIERGVWHGFKEHNVPFLLAQRYIAIFKLSDKIFYRELGLFEIYDRYNLNRDKFYFDYNKVKIKEEPHEHPASDHLEVLYLNGFKSFRRLDLLIKAIPIVRLAVPQARFKIVGARSEADLVFARRELEKIEATDIAEVFYWNPNPDIYYNKASVFVLPAELVFCNFSLIEAMERGVAPVVTRVEDADKIIEDGVDGVLCDMSEHAIASAIVFLLQNEEKRKEIGKQARLKIMKDFNSAKRLDPILEIVESKWFRNGN